MSAHCRSGAAPRVAANRSSISLRVNGSSSYRRSSPSFHSAVTASGAGAPARIVAITVAARRSTNWCSTNADKSSRRRASSTTTSTGAPFGDAVTLAITLLTSCSGSPSSRSAHCAHAPSGIDRAARVPVTQRTAQPRSAARAIASRASRVLPTPAEPEITTPTYGLSGQNASAMTLSSSARPVSGQVCIREC